MQLLDSKQNEDTHGVATALECVTPVIQIFKQFQYPHLIISYVLENFSGQCEKI